MNNKNTGLGASLLLQQTTPTPSEPQPQPVQVIEHVEPRPEPAEPAQKPPVPPRPLRDRCTIYLEPELNAHLRLVAKLEDRQRSDIVADLLRAHLPTYRIDRVGE